MVTTKPHHDSSERRSDFWSIHHIYEVIRRQIRLEFEKAIWYEEQSFQLKRNWKKNTYISQNAPPAFSPPKRGAILKLGWRCLFLSSRLGENEQRKKWTKVFSQRVKGGGFLCIVYILKCWVERKKKWKGFHAKNNNPKIKTKSLCLGQNPCIGGGENCILCCWLQIILSISLSCRNENS